MAFAGALSTSATGSTTSTLVTSAASPRGRWLWSAGVAVLLAALLAALPRLVAVRYHVIAPGAGAVVVTGASSGIGRHAAEALAARGWLVFAGVRSAASADALRAAGVPLLEPLVLDVTSAASRARAAADVAAALRARGRVLAGLVNNAGLARVGLPLEFEPEATTREVFETNVFGALATTQAFLPLLRAARGRVVMVSSIAGLVSPQPTWGSYGASKFALEALSDALRRELAGVGVSVSVLEPAFVKTDIAGAAARAADGADTLALRARARAAYPHIGDYAAVMAAGVARGDSPAVTSDAIAHALESPTPSTRYVVASVVDGANRVPAAVVAWLEWLLPDRVMDAIVAGGAPPPRAA